MGRPWLPGALGVVAVLAYSVVATRFEPYTTPMRAATAMPCVALAGLAVRRGWMRLRGPGGATAEPQRLTPILVWGVLIVVAVAFQLAVYFSSPRNTYPTLSSLASIAFGWTGVRPAAFAAWLWLGWYLVER